MNELTYCTSKKLSLLYRLQRLGNCYTLRYKMTLGNNTLSMGELFCWPGAVQTYWPTFANRFVLCVQFCKRTSHSFSVDECFLFFSMPLFLQRNPWSRLAPCCTPVALTALLSMQNTPLKQACWMLSSSWVRLLNWTWTLLSIVVAW